MNQTSEEKLKHWKNLITEKKQSGLLVKDFCKEKNITPAQFYYYHGIINRPVKVIRQENSKIASIKIIEPTAKEQNVIRFILPNSLQCVLPSSLPLSEIKAMLKVLMSCWP